MTDKMANIIRIIAIIVAVLLISWAVFPSALTPQSRRVVVDQQDMGNGVICYFPTGGGGGRSTNPTLFCVKVRS